MAEPGPAPKLTRRQRQAIEATGHTAIRAGAGTGKTTTLVHRAVRELVRANDPSEVAAITFTRNAAEELRGRIAAELKDDRRRLDLLDDATIGTIHGFCLRLIAWSGSESTDAEARVLEETQTSLLIRDVADQVLQEPSIQADAERLLTAIDPARLRNLLETALDRHPIAAKALATDVPQDPRLLIPPGLVQDLLGLRDACAVLAKDFAAAMPEVSAALARAASAGGADALRTFQTAVGALQRNDGKWRSLGRKRLPEGTPQRFEAFQRAIDDLPWRPWQALEPGNPLDAAWSDLQVPLRRVVAAALDAYARRKRDEAALDYEDLLQAGLAVASTPELCNRVAARLRVVLVDELQDTDPRQWTMLEALGRAGVTIVAVGDERQSIYGFRQADPGTFARALEWIRAAGGTVVELQENHRSRPAIVRLANDLHRHASALYEGSMGRSEPIEPTRSGVGDVLVPQLAEGSTEQDLAAACVASAIQDGTPAERIAVLLRSGAPLQELLRALERRGIPALVTISRGLLSQQPAQDLAQLLQLLLSPWRDDCALAVLRSPLLALQDPVVHHVAAVHEAEHHGLWDALRTCAGTCARPEVVRARDALDRWQNLLALGVDVLLADVLVHAPVLPAAAAWPDAAARIAVLEAAAEELAHLVSGTTRTEAVRRLDVMTELDRLPLPAPPVPGAVRIMTVHGAKGLEFDAVVVAFLGRSVRGSDTSFGFLETPAGALLAHQVPDPDTGRPGKPTPLLVLQMLEERDRAAEAQRLLYVAATRARDRLVLPQPRLDEPKRRPAARDAWAHVLHALRPPRPEDAPAEARPMTRLLLHPPDVHAAAPVQAPPKSKALLEDPSLGAAVHAALEAHLLGLPADAAAEAAALRMGRDPAEVGSALGRVLAQLEPHLRGATVLPEWRLALPQGEGRADLILARDGEALVVEIKTGRITADHRQQLDEYVEALGRAGWRARGILVSARKP